MFMALVWTAALMAQKIAVVDANGSTQVFKTLQEAIEGAADGSVVYLPGGGFSCSSAVPITKKLTIIGIGHKAQGENVDGYTIIDGSLFFTTGSSGSAVLGCYITGGIDIGIVRGTSSHYKVEDILVRYCNVRYVGVSNQCSGIEINQCFLRSTNDTNHNGRNTKFTNNVLNCIGWVGGGTISNNIFIGECGHISSSILKNNIFMTNPSNIDNCILSNNLYKSELGEGIDWKDVFVNYDNGEPSSSSDFHFKPEYAQYQGQVGIYSGDGFSDDQLAPVPYIVSKDIDEQTDAAGNLKVRIRVKAGGQE